MRAAVCLVLTVLSLVGLAACSDVSDAEDPDVALLGAGGSGDPLPEATLEVLGGEGEIRTSSFEGQPTVINFWAVWCPFCVEEMPDLEAAHQRLGDAVRFVGVDREDPDQDPALRLADETGVTYLLVRDPQGEYYRAVGGRGMPTTLLVDADGRIRFRHSGPLTTQQLLDLVEEHLDVRG